jgi:hypothetical protein
MIGKKDPLSETDVRIMTHYCSQCEEWYALPCPIHGPPPVKININVENTSFYAQLKGWVCPRCQKVWSPYVTQCNCSPGLDPETIR